MEAGDYSRATRLLSSALEIHLFEVPNFHALSRLAQAQWLAGDSAAARWTLEQAKIALSILVGAYKCVERGIGFAVVDRSGAPIPESDDAAAAAARRMCGAAYDYYYERREFEAIVADAELIKIFWEARRLIEGR